MLPTRSLILRLLLKLWCPLHTMFRSQAVHQPTFLLLTAQVLLCPQQRDRAMLGNAEDCEQQQNPSNKHCTGDDIGLLPVMAYHEERPEHGPLC